jgi:hypothetical protein
LDVTYTIILINLLIGDDSKKEYNRRASELSNSYRAFQYQKHTGTTIKMRKLARKTTKLSTLAVHCSELSIESQ